ncbi:unnamed protein product [Chrysodeixis includens]|uniref:E3 ubiquitin-protein ligase n=1 Tax=Chrysodeixis includens TaxID=689277 RepID=A0A9P0BTN6_CHRIL|nr:unnamed protein product [Chrysodeixis includens]
MGNKQSSETGKDTPPNLSEEQVKRLLESQRKIYEEKCRELMKQVSEQKSGEDKTPSQSANTTPTGNVPQNVAQQKPQNLYPQIPIANPNIHVQQAAYPPAAYANPPQGYQYVVGQNANAPPAPVPHGPQVYQQAVPHPLYQQTYGQHPVPQPLLPQRPPIPDRPSQRVLPQTQPQPTNTFNNATPNLTRPVPAIPTAPPAPRERSKSRPRITTAEFKNSSVDELDCATCGAPLGVGIFRCSRGHNSCVNCKRSGQRCRLCFQPILQVRNYDLELKAAQRKVACPNKEDGCNAFVKQSEMESHTAKCPFQPQKCPLSSVFGNCDWTGQLYQMSSHFKSLHPAQRQTNVDTELTLQNVTKNSRQLVLVVLGVYNFVLHVKVSESERNIYMAVQLIGTKNSAEKWIYEIHVYNKNEAIRKYTFIDNCNPSSESVDKVFQQRKCAVLPFAYANTFVYKDVLTYKVYMKKIEDPSDKPKRVRKVNQNQKETA